MNTANKVKTNSIGWLLKSLSKGLDIKMLSELKPLGINLGQFSILMTLLDTDGLSQSEIGKIVVMPGYATTRNIDALEKKQLLQRKDNITSRRSNCIFLTSKGKALQENLFSIVAKVNKNLLANLNQSEAEKLKTLLQKIILTSS